MRVKSPDAALASADAKTRRAHKANEAGQHAMQLACARVRARHGVLLVEPGHDVGIQPAVAQPA
jgi:hypothetical protein